MINGQMGLGHQRLKNETAANLKPIAGSRSPAMAWETPAPAVLADLGGTKPRALIVDGDAAASDALAGFLANNGLMVMTARDGRGMDQALETARFDVVILNVEPPTQDGLSLCRRLSSARLAIILLSAECEEVDRIVGLELGADAYLPKTCCPRELLARIRAVLRRRERLRVGAARFAPTYRFGAFELDTIHDRLFRPSGEATVLTKSEFQLLVARLDRPDQIVRRESLTNLGEAHEIVSRRAVDVKIARLRRKLGCAARDEVIRTVRGVGYRLSVPVTRTAEPHWPRSAPV
jgi:two-component system OmpR family response regulator